MKIKWAMLTVLSLTWPDLVHTRDDDCALQGSKTEVLLVNILVDGDQLGRGVLVSRGRLLSAFRPFVKIAQYPTLLPNCEFIAYAISTGDACRQERKATKIVPPVGWPRLPADQVRNAAVWEFDEQFNVTADLLLSENHDTSKLEKANEDTHVGTQCNISWFIDEDFVETVGSKVVQKSSKTTIRDLQDCEKSFCQDGVCNLKEQYDFCVDDKREPGDMKNKQPGALLICEGEAIGFLGQVGQKSSKGLALFINILTVWDVYKEIASESAAIKESTANTDAEWIITETKEAPVTHQPICTCDKTTTKTNVHANGERPSINDDPNSDRLGLGTPVSEYDYDGDGAGTLASVHMVLALCTAAVTEICYE